MGFFQPVHLPRLSARWATVLLNLVALTYSTNTVFVKSIEEAPAKPLPSLACLVRFLIATAALGFLSQLFTSKTKAAPVAKKGFAEETRAGAGETSQVLNKAETQIAEGTPRNRRASRELPLRSKEELGDLFEIPLDSTKGIIRSSPRLSPFSFAPAGWQREASTPRDGLQDQAALHSKATRLSQVELKYADGLYKGAEDKMQSNHSHETEEGKPRSPVIASVELGVLMFLGFGAQAVALETAKAGQVSLLFTISIILVPLLESVGGKPLKPATMIATSLSIIGTGLLEYRGSGLGVALPSFGDTWGLVSAIAFAIHVVRSEVYAKSWRSLSSHVGSEPARYKREEKHTNSSETVPLTKDGPEKDRDYTVHGLKYGDVSNRTKTPAIAGGQDLRFGNLVIKTVGLRDRQSDETSVRREAPTIEAWSPVFLVIVQMVVVTALSLIWWLVELAAGLYAVVPAHEMSQLETATWVESFVYQPIYHQLRYMPWPAMIYTGVVSTGLCEWLEFHCLQSVRASTCVLIYTAISIYGAFFAWLLRGEVLGLSGFLGAAAVIGSSAWVQVGELSAAANEDGGASDRQAIE